MADVVKKATRQSYGEAITALADQYPNLIVFDADLAKATKTDIFMKAHPERHFDCGIAECNMTGVAAGASTCGYIPFVSTFAMFAAGRAFEQVRNSIGYPHLNVKIGATHAGISVGEDGATHQCCEDIALMRTIPGMTIINPADDIEAKAAVAAAVEYVGPVYMRFARLATPVFNNPDTYKFELGKGIQLVDGKDITIIATGPVNYEAVKAAEILKADGISARVINIHTIKPIDRDIIIKAAKETGLLLTVEEHTVIGGLGEAVSEVVCTSCPVPVFKIGIQDEFGYSGNGEELLKRFGLTAPDIAARAKELVTNRK